MKPNRNQVVLTGRIGNEPELSKTHNSTPVCNIRLCTTETWTDKSGVKQTTETWVTAVGWNWIAEECIKFVKNDFIQITGSISNRQRIHKVEGQEDFKYIVTEIKIESISRLE